MSSCSTPNTIDGRLNSKEKNAYFVVSSPTLRDNINVYDPKRHKYYLTARAPNERFPLSSEAFAPSSEENNKKENKQTTSPMVDKRSNAENSNNSNNLNNNVNPVSTSNKEITNLKNLCDSPSNSIFKSTGAIPKNNTIVNPYSNPKVQIGMDRYISVTKRKSSPRTLRLEPTPKQSRPNTVSQNRFALLENLENEAASAKPTKDYKPPPLYLREPTSNILVKKLTELLGKENFYVVSIRKGNISETKIQVYSEKTYRILIDRLDSEKKNYYTYQLKSAKGLIVVVKGIDSSVPTDEIKEALESQGYEVKSVHNIINKNKVPQPLFRVEVSFNSSQLKKKGDTHPIYGLKFLLNRRITVEEPIKRKGPPQCLNCQEFGHTRSFCKLPSVCVRCGDIHKSLECPHSKSDNNYKKCSNCGQNHTANYRGCPVFLQLKEKLKPRKPVYAQYQNSYFPSLSGKNIFSTQHGNNDYQQSSYAQIAKDGSKQNIQNNEAAIRNQPKIKVATQKPNVENNTQQLSYAHALKKGPAIYNLITENNDQFSGSSATKDCSAAADINTQSSIEKLVETMNSFMTNMQNMFQQLMQNQSMLMQILLNKK